MHIVGAVAGFFLILVILIDGFETILQPRRVTHRFRFARLYYRGTWKAWRAAGLCVPAGKQRESFLGAFGPLSLVGLFAAWTAGLVVGFALVHWSCGTRLNAPESVSTFATCLYLSGTTFFTLGLGDVTPGGSLGRILVAGESALGFFFLAVMISYLPVLYQAYSRREITISLLDARAGSPPSGAECLIRLSRGGLLRAGEPMLAEWETWAAELLESHLSFPALSYYRSQHDNQSWIAALTCILDACALLLVEVKNVQSYRARLTFAMARHAAVDLALILKTPPAESNPDRLPMDERRRMEQALRDAGVELQERADTGEKFAELRAMYEPFLNALARRFLISIPPILSKPGVVDNWQTSAWMRRTPGIGNLHAADPQDDHFE